MPSNPDRSSRINPSEGFSHIIILLISAIILSWDTILILPAFSEIDRKVVSSIENPSCVANLTALNILSGSSENVIPGSRGVLIILFLRSSVPLKGSRKRPKESLPRLTAMAFMVKSLLFWSSSRVPSSTTGFLEPLSYDSFLAPTNSISYSFHRNMAVPKFLNTLTLIPGSIL